MYLAESFLSEGAKSSSSLVCCQYAKTSKASLQVNNIIGTNQSFRASNLGSTCA